VRSWGVLSGSVRRTRLGLLVGVAAVVVIAVPLSFFHDRLSLATPALLLVLPVLVAAVVGGRRPSIVAAVCAALAFNVLFIPPVLTLKIRFLDDVVAFLVFVTVAAVIGTLVGRQSDRRLMAEQHAIEIAKVHSELVEVTAERERLAVEAQRVAVLEAVDRQRSALMRAVSHDLRTPLVTISGVSSDLRSGEFFDESTRNGLLDLVISEAERLDRLVANLLSFSRIEAGALNPHLEVVDCDEIIDRCVRRLRRLFPGSSLAVDVSLDLPPLLADPGLLDQVLTNLLENASRHGSKHTRVSASVADGMDATNGFIVIGVDDDGPGLGHADHERIFEPWNEFGNGPLSGLGLAICKSVVEAHGGRIWADDNPDGGARFCFTIPVFVDDDDDP
jgi:two-component system, OmpR family, sensor histidine kinase KdpD